MKSPAPLAAQGSRHRPRLPRGPALPPLYATRGGSGLAAGGALLRDPVRQREFLLRLLRPLADRLAGPPDMLADARLLGEAQRLQPLAALPDRFELRLPLRRGRFVVRAFCSCFATARSWACFFVLTFHLCASCAARRPCDGRRLG